MPNVLGYAKNNWPSEFLDWPDSPADRTSSLSMQFGISVSNHMQTEATAGYTSIPYTQSGYPDVDIWAAQELYTQATFVLVGDSGLWQQFTSTINKDFSLKNQILEKFDQTRMSGYQFLSSISDVRRLNNQFLVRPTVDSSLRNSFKIELSQTRNLRGQFWVTPFEENPILSQVFMYCPIFLIGGSDYCKFAWPSLEWPYVDVYGYKTLFQFTVTPVERSRKNYQFNVSANARSRFKFQYYASPISRIPLHTSYYAPLSLVVERATVAFYCQWRYSKAVGFRTEIRWRPF